MILVTFSSVEVQPGSRGVTGVAEHAGHAEKFDKTAKNTPKTEVFWQFFAFFTQIWPKHAGLFDFFALVRRDRFYDFSDFQFSRSSIMLSGKSVSSSLIRFFQIRLRFLPVR